MSSSAPQAAAGSRSLAFRLRRCAWAGRRAGSASDASQSAEERSRRLQAEVFEQGRQSGQQQLRTEFDAALAKNRGADQPRAP